MSVTTTGVSSGSGGVAEVGVRLVVGALSGTGVTASVGAVASGVMMQPSLGRPVPDTSVIGARGIDQVVIRPASSLPVFQEMATNGLRQLGLLLPLAQRQLAISVSLLTPAPLGTLARAIGDAAHQVSAGFVAIAAAASPSTEGNVGPGAGKAKQAEPEVSQFRVSVAADGDGSKTLSPLMTKSSGSAPVDVAPLTDDLAGQGKSPAISAALISSVKADPAIERANARQGAGETNVLNPVPRPSMTSEATVRPAVSSNEIADGPAASLNSMPGGDQTRRGSTVGAQAADPGPYGRDTIENAAGDTSDAGTASRMAARQILQQASDTLEKMSERLQPTAAPLLSVADNGMSFTPELLWAMAQVQGAQRQVSGSMAVLSGRAPRRRTASGGSRRLSNWGDSGQLSPLNSAVALFGGGLVLLLIALATGLWITSVTTIGLGAGFCTALLWGWRVSIGARGLRIALRR